MASILLMIGRRQREVRMEELRKKEGCL